MVDSSWQNEAPVSSRKGWPLWLKILMGLLLAVGALVAFVVIRVQVVRAQAWPIVRQVAQRLQSDEGARDLFVKNPRLQRKYSSAENFIEQVKAHRSDLAALPEVEPSQDQTRYRVFPSPAGFFLLMRLSKTSWMQLSVQRRSGQGKNAVGEGIADLSFAASREELLQGRSRMRALAHDPEWQRYRQAVDSLRTDEGTRTLYAASPRLKKSFPTETIFFEQARQWRTGIDALPEHWNEAKGQGELKRVHTPFSATTTLSYRMKDGRTLTLRWENEELNTIRWE